MRSPIKGSRPLARVKKGKFLSSEDYNHELEVYFKSAKKQKIGRVEMPDNGVSDTPFDNELELEQQIEKNQILYSKLLAQKLKKRKF